ncbi:hypothetical protein [Kangiella spongicola]|uniref:Uncharacterized protein n=1 Tax=Kangiella spongicola TaxID=796379 RepID=A0A318D1D3_9GAMM|nr:hypothetical protein [Kangiella spongicola]PXF63032.1 hypothetical protein DL796_06150 [Kangiella spongicola]
MNIRFILISILLALIQLLIACKDSSDNPKEVGENVYGRIAGSYQDIKCSHDNSCVSNADEFKQAIARKEEQIILKNGNYDLGVISIDYPVKIGSSKKGAATVTG